MSPLQVPAPSTPQPPLLSAGALSFFMQCAGLLSGPIDTDQIEESCQHLCQQFNAKQIVAGWLDKKQDNIYTPLVYQRRKLSWSIKTDAHKATDKHINKLQQDEGWIKPNRDAELFQLINQASKNQKPFYYISHTVDSHSPRSRQWFLALNCTMPSQGKTKSEFNFLLSECARLVLSALAGHFFDLQLKEESEQLSTAINISDSIYATWHEKAGWQYHNINGFIKLGYNPNTFDISWVQENNPMHPDDWQSSLVRFRNLVKNGVDYQHEYRACCPDGSTLWYYANTKLAESNGRGGARMLTSISRDINAIKIAEKEAVDALQREQWLMEQTHNIYNCQDFSDFVPIMEAVGRHLNLNRCSIRIVDPETKLINLVAEWHQPELTALQILFPEMTTETGMGWIDGLIQHGHANISNIAVEENSRRMRKYFQAIGCQAHITQPMIANNKLTGYLAVLSSEPRQWTEDEIHLTSVIADTIHTTITRNRLLDELRTSEERIQLAMINSTYSLWDHKPQEDSLYLSPHFYTALGYSTGNCEFHPRELLDLVHPDDQPKLASLPKEQYLSDSGEINLELRLRRKNGSYSWLLCRGKVIKRDKDNRPLHVMGINLDINQLKETVEELRVAREKAEAANHSKSEFLERMSHEIRTPMNAILGMSYLALDSELNREQRANLEDIEAAAKSLLHVIDDILDFSKIESGELIFVDEKFDLHQTVNKVVKLFTVRARESNNKLQITIAEDIPQFVIGDPNRVGQVITNLVSNAVKFTRDGLVEISLQLAEYNAKNNSVSILFSVSDSGIGLAKTQLQNIFQPFTQADGSTTRKFGGTGLGLSICKHLVEMMGGSIHAISLPKIGTTFHFTIVFKQARDGSNQSKLAKEKSAVKLMHEVPDYFQDKKVLLTEDNIVNQRVAIGILKKFNLDVVTANNGQEALIILESTQQNYFDAILMDIEMPVLDGLEATKRLRQLDAYRDIPIIAMTAHAMLGDKERCIESGMNDYIPKPVHPDTLFSVLSNIWSPDRNLPE